MHDAGEFLRDLAAVLCVAAVTTVLFARLRQPVVLGYLLAGVILGRAGFAEGDTVRTLSEVGVILLMFSIGLEFTIRKIVRMGRTSGLIALVETSLMLWLGSLAGLALGLPARASVFCGAMVAISSTTIVAKALSGRLRRGRLPEIVFGVLVFEDLIAVLLIAVLTAVAGGAGLSGRLLVLTTAQLLAFLVTLLVAGLVLIPPVVRAAARAGREGRDETLLVAAVGLCFATALAARAAGTSVALGAFLAGALVAESGQGARVEHAIRPVRDMFAAVFFVAIGMLVEPAQLRAHAGAVAMLSALVVAGKIAAVSLGAVLAGHPVRTSVQAGMSLAQIGEFSFILVGVGVSLGAVDPSLGAIAVAVSAVTTFATPWLIRASDRAAAAVERRLPAPVHTLVGLYGSWLERVRAAGIDAAGRRPARRLVGLLALDAAVLAALAIGTAVALPALTGAIARGAGTDRDLARALAIGAALAIATPFAVGLLRAARRLGAELAARALPAAESGQADLAAAPRRALVVVLQLAIVLAAAAPLLAVTQPFLPAAGVAAVAAALGAALVALGVAFWRSAEDLQGHVRAGAEIVLEAFATGTAHGPGDPLGEARRLLPGLAGLAPVRLEGRWHAVGRSLADLDLRGASGAMVLAIRRGAETLVAPDPSGTLRAGDVLVLCGPDESLDAARRLLAEGREAAAQAE